RSHQPRDHVSRRPRGFRQRASQHRPLADTRAARGRRAPFPFLPPRSEPLLSTPEKANRPASFLRRRRKWPYVTVALVLLGAGSAYAVRAPKQEIIDQTLVVTAKRAPLAIEVIDVGRVEAFEEVEILS